MKKFKLYKVSLAFKVPVNYELEVLARSEEEAIKLAIDKAPSDVGGFTEPDCSEAMPDFDEDFKDGIYIKEVGE